MSYNHSGRRAAPLVLAGILALTTQLPAHADSSGPRLPGTYLVQLADAPVAVHEDTRAPAGRRLDTGTRAAREYVDHLGERRDDVLAGVPGVKPLRTFTTVVNGFTARLTSAQIGRLSRMPGVVSVTRNQMLPLAGEAGRTGTGRATAARTSTTKPPASPPYAREAAPLPVPDMAAFLGLKGEHGLYSRIPGGQANAGRGTIIGVVDSGIDTGNPSLGALPADPVADKAIAAKWKGGCDPGKDPAHRATCNNKVIGAQYFPNDGVVDTKAGDWDSPRDSDSHGTSTATTAAGNLNIPTTVPDTGLTGRISGLAPAARIAAYKVCWVSACGYNESVAAIDKAVADGVDVINYSIGGPDLSVPSGVLETALRNAAEAGVFISAAAGNEGPGTVRHEMPWVMSVAASTHDTGYRTTLTLGDGRSYDGVGFSATALPATRLVDSARAGAGGVTEADARLCAAGSLDPAKVRGAVVLCTGNTGRVAKSVEVQRAGGVGMVLVNEAPGEELIADAHRVPSVHLTSADGASVRAYAERAGATAELSAAVAVPQRAPVVAGFSSSGPETVNGGDLIKPDVTAPGVGTVAATVAGSFLYKGSQGLFNGTSDSAPHVAGLALLLRQSHPSWSVAALKSALMTTASTTDNTGRPIQRTGAGTATPFDYGAGHVVPSSAADPGLVYDAGAADWTAYTCTRDGKLTSADGGAAACAGVPRLDASDVNYPMIAVGDLVGRQTVTRKVTNVAATTGVYTVRVQAPRGFTAEVTPQRLTLAPGASATYTVAFTRTDAAFGAWSFGAVTWSDGHHQVRSAVSLRAEVLDAPSEVTASGAEGSVKLTPRTGWAGTLTAGASLYGGEKRTGTLTGTDHDFDPNTSPLTPATYRTTFTVPAGLKAARVGISAADYAAGSDIDLYVKDDATGDFVHWAADSSDEHADLKPGTYTVYVNQYVVPSGVTSQPFALRYWLIGSGAGHAAAVSPASQRVAMGAEPGVGVSWKGLSADVSPVYLGVVEYGDGSRTVGRTLLSVSVPRR
ncbi:S8 family serine peptidase [Streptomyces roseirectus]|uniref:S8 family serine peptidase n=1 Tax=Streptomyces roseirectus TaxID=2768066 RepID=A0A7H0I7E3_9ACTN|nr:S8 family serine peptidase [Streptomyces roseirectus]QNP68709.1 S8 family serine peptidase [Streptomyces roseirectus]